MAATEEYPTAGSSLNRARLLTEGPPNFANYTYRRTPQTFAEEDVDENITLWLRRFSHVFYVYDPDDIAAGQELIVYNNAWQHTEPEHTEVLSYDGDFDEWDTEIMVWVSFDLINSTDTQVGAGLNPTSNQGLRWLTHFNPRNRLLAREPQQWNPGTGLWQTQPLIRHQTSAGPLIPSINEWEPSSGSIAPVLYDIPRQDLHSIAQLQHANLAQNSYGPSYAIGNSFANPFVESNQVVTRLGAQSAVDNGLAHDYSYRSNQLLWDNYYFSTIPWDFSSANIDEPLPNSRLIFNDHARNLEPGDLDVVALDGERSLSLLELDGPFNVNSTSVAAWAALLSGTVGQTFRYYDAETQTLLSDDVGDGGLDLEAAFPRMLQPMGGRDALNWRGYRVLDEEQIYDLAEAIVDQVRARGPFLSLSQFVNRSLSAGTNPESLMGPLQAAIAEADINPSGPEILTDSPLTLPFPEAFLGQRDSSAPGYLTQADILSQIGPMLTVRGDTFIVRAYGDVRTPLSDEAISRAWCEAVVRRTADWGSDGLAPSDIPTTGTVADLFGRNFEIVSLRWLKPEEI